MARIGIIVVGGIIDNGYTGEIMIMLANMSKKEYSVEIGDKIAQGIIRKNYPVVFNHVFTLNKTSRGINGFGSSGK